MLRLADSRPLLWRTATHAQLGADDGVDLDDISPWQEHLVAALVRGIPDAMALPLAAAHGASEPAVAAFLTTIGPALAPPLPPPTQVCVSATADLTFSEQSTLLSALTAGGVDVVAPPPSRILATLLVAHRLSDPRHSAQLLASDTTHVALVLDGDRVTAGPVVVPGRTACLSCVHAWRAQHDPQWMTLASQLLSRAPAPTHPGLLLEGALLAARMLTQPEAFEGLSVTVTAQNGRRFWRRHRVHPQCSCQSLAGNARAGDHGFDSSAPTTS